MKKIILAVCLAIIVLSVGSFFLFKLKDRGHLKIIGSSLEALANNGVIVEVIQGQVIVNLGGQEKTLSAPLNQEIEKEAVLTTAAGSQANIIFPSGSIARLDENTTVKLADFGEGDQSISIKLQLEGGNLWSRVQRLADKETNYEVETSNTVAVVKGTSFNVFYGEGKTKLEVISNKVVLRAIDPQNGQKIEGGEVEVESGNFVEADEKVLPSREKPLEIKPILQESFQKTWLKANLEKDKKIEETILKSLGGGEVKKENLKQVILPAVITLQKEVLAKENLSEPENKNDQAVNQDKENSDSLPSSVPTESIMPKTPEPTPSQAQKTTPRPSFASQPAKTQPADVLTSKLSIVSISPNSAPGPSYQYTKVTIKGTGFVATTKASVGSYLLGDQKVIGMDTLVGSVPAKVPVGTYDVILTSGTQKAVLTGGFKVVDVK